MARCLRKVGDFGIAGADLGVECRDCRTVTVYCDFEAQRSFAERKWSALLPEAITRFRCRCGSTNLRFKAVPMNRRPRPIPKKPKPLRPIYREDARALMRRQPYPFPDSNAVDSALEVLRAACARGVPGQTEEVKGAMEVLRPFMHGENPMSALWDELSIEAKSKPWCHATLLLRGVEQQLGFVDPATKLVDRLDS